MPNMLADDLEKAVWKRLKKVMTDHEALRDSLRNTLEDLRQRRNSLNKGSDFTEKELQTVYDKKERLALVYADQAIIREVYEKRMDILKRKESELLKARTNLDPLVKIELGEFERGIASLEKAIEGKSGKLFLTELGVWVDNIPDDWIAGRLITGVDSWDDPEALINTETFQVGEYGLLMSMVDGLPQSNFEVPRETVWRNIRRILEWLGIRVYIFRDRIEIRGFIPTEVIDVSGAGNATNRGSIIPSIRGRGYRG